MATGSMISADPGKLSLAWAYFEDDVLQQCGLIREKKRQKLHEAFAYEFGFVDVELAIVEVPQVYQQRFLKGDPNDLIEVALTAGAFLSAANALEIDTVRPRGWKGTRPKEVCNALTLKTLSETEKKVLGSCGVPRSLAHNIMDAVGIGLWTLGRR